MPLVVEHLVDELWELEGRPVYELGRWRGIEIVCKSYVRQRHGIELYRSLVYMIHNSEKNWYGTSFIFRLFNVFSSPADFSLRIVDLVYINSSSSEFLTVYGEGSTR